MTLSMPSMVLTTTYPIAKRSPHRLKTRRHGSLCCSLSRSLSFQNRAHSGAVRCLFGAALKLTGRSGRQLVNRARPHCQTAHRRGERPWVAGTYACTCSAPERRREAVRNGDRGKLGFLDAGRLAAIRCIGRRLVPCRTATLRLRLAGLPACHVIWRRAPGS